MKKLFIIILACIASCTKDTLVDNNSYLQLKVEGAQQSFTWEEIDATWTFRDKQLKLYATSDEQHRFTIELYNIADTGLYSPANFFIGYNDDGTFRSERLVSGYIHITTLTNSQIKADFDVTLLNSYSIIEQKRFTGTFGITQHQ